MEHMPLSARAAPSGRHVLDAEHWLLALFSSKAARSGGVVRRAIADVERICGLDVFRVEIERRGFMAITDGRQIVVFCHSQPVRRIA